MLKHKCTKKMVDARSKSIDNQVIYDWSNVKNMLF